VEADYLFSRCEKYNEIYRSNDLTEIGINRAKTPYLAEIVYNSDRESLPYILDCNEGIRMELWAWLTHSAGIYISVAASSKSPKIASVVEIISGRVYRWNDYVN